MRLRIVGEGLFSNLYETPKVAGDFEEARSETEAGLARGRKFEKVQNWKDRLYKFYNTGTWIHI